MTTVENAMDMPGVATWGLRVGAVGKCDKAASMVGVHGSVLRTNEHMYAV